MIDKLMDRLSKTLTGYCFDWGLTLIKNNTQSSILAINLELSSCEERNELDLLVQTGVLSPWDQDWPSQ